MARVSLEDNFTDIIGKAQRGLHLSDTELTARAGVSEDEVRRVKSGEVIEPVLRKVAAVLKLGPSTLVESARQAWYPPQIEVAGLAQFTTPYHDMTVNAYVVWVPPATEVVVFDTGADAGPMLQFLKVNNLAVRIILLTHSHGDHIADLQRVKKETGANAFASEAEPVRGAEPFTEGRVFTVGPLRIITRQTSGHSAGGTTYVVSGLSHPVAVVGDALFAGSMGGGMVSYLDALTNNRQKIMTLPDETILCPGHGPLTLVGEEKRHNPFFPEFQSTTLK